MQQQVIPPASDPKASDIDKVWIIKNIDIVISTLMSNGKLLIHHYIKKI